MTYYVASPAEDRRRLRNEVKIYQGVAGDYGVPLKKADRYYED